MSNTSWQKRPNNKVNCIAKAIKKRSASLTKRRTSYALVCGAIAACLLAGCGSDNNQGAAGTFDSAAGASPISGTAGNTPGAGATANTGAGGSNSKPGTAGKSAPTAGKAGKGAGTKAGAGGASGKGSNGGAAGEEKCTKIPASSKDCNAPLAPGDDRKCSITIAGAERSYYMYAPPTYNPCKKTALVVDCHGASETAEQQAGLDSQFMGDLYPGKGSGWRLEADTKGGGFIVLNPQGISNVWNTANNDDQLMLDIIAQTKKVANIDEKKVYMTGISNGSMITYQTVCPNTEVFAGISPHAAGVSCASITKPIPVISFDAEPDFAYQGTVEASANMVKLNGCTGTEDKAWLTIDSKYNEPVCRNDPYDTNPTLVPCSSIKETSLGPIKPTVCRRTDGCKDGASVVFCEVAPSTRNGAASAATDAHIIYGNATSLNTPSVAWRFFKSFWK